MKPTNNYTITRLIKWLCKTNKLSLIKDIYPIYNWSIEIQDQEDVYNTENLFHFCCRKNYIKVVELILQIDDNIDIYEKNQEGLALACEGGHLELVKFLLNLKDYKHKDYKDLLVHASISGNIETVGFLMSNISLKETINIRQIILNCCIYNNTSLLNWFLHTKIPGLCQDYDYYDMCFYQACESGNLELCKLVYNSKTIDNGYLSRSLIDIHHNNNVCFLIAIQDGYYNLARWIYLIDRKINLVENDCEYFKEACINGNLEIAKWLSNYTSINLDYNSIFSETVYLGYIEIAKWIFQNHDIEISSENILNICLNGSLNDIKWVLQETSQIISDNIVNVIVKTGKVSVIKLLSKMRHIRLHQDYFKISIRLGNTEMVKWLYSKSRFTITQQDILNSCKSGEFDLIKWLLNLSCLTPNKECLSEICKSGDLTSISYIQEKSGTQLKPSDFETIVSKGDLPLIQWAVEKTLTPITQKHFELVSGCNNLDLITWIYDQNPDNICLDNLFFIINKNINIEVIKWFHKKSNSFKLGSILKSQFNNTEAIKWYHNITPITKLNQDRLFMLSIASGNIDLLEWIFSIGDISLDESHFRFACLKGYLKLAKWMFNIKKFDIPDTYLLFNLTKKNNLEMIDWLYENSDKTIILDQENFNKICGEIGDLAIAKWVHKTLEIKPNKDTFIAASKNGRLEILKWLYNFKDFIYLTSLDEECFSEALLYNNYDIIKWIYNRGTFKIHDQYFVDACELGEIYILSWIYYNSEIKIKKYHFVTSLNANNLEVAKWLYQKGNFTLEESDFSLSVKHGYHDLAIWINQVSNIDIRPSHIYDACRGGNLNLFNYLVNYISPEIVKPECFIISCETGYMDILEWSNTSNISQKKKIEGFNMALERGFIDICKIIYHEIGDIVKETRDLLGRACYSENLEIVKWTYQNIIDINDTTEIYKSFLESCDLGSYEIVKWMVENIELDINHNNEEPFRTACRSGSLELVEYLVSKNVEIRSLNDEGFILACKSNNKQLVDYMTELIPDYCYSEKYDNENDETILMPVIKDTIEYYILHEKWDLLKNKLPINNGIHQVTCSICYETGNLETPCKHIFCVKCLGSWFKKSNICPYCNQEFNFRDCSIKIDSLSN